MRSFLHGAFAVVCLVLMIVGVGMVMAYVLGGATLGALAIGATLATFAWHGLRGIGPRPEGDDAVPDEWPYALVQLAFVGALFALAFWNPWLIVFAWVVLVVLRRRGRVG